MYINGSPPRPGVPSGFKKQVLKRPLGQLFCFWHRGNFMAGNGLIIGKPFLHFGNKALASRITCRVAIIIVVPNVHTTFFVWVDDGGRAIKYGAAGVPDDIVDTNSFME